MNDNLKAFLCQFLIGNVKRQGAKDTIGIGPVIACQFLIGNVKLLVVATSQFCLTVRVNSS